MKARCYYCDKELTERTIKRHMKNCPEMKKVIEEKKENSKGNRNQFMISIKNKYTSEYCIYVSIDANLQLQHLDKFIRDVWVECCDHLSAFFIDGEMYNNTDYEMNVKLKDVLSVNQKFEYQYDFGSTTYLKLEVIDLIEVPKEFTQIEIIARNNEIKENCCKCGKEAKYHQWEKNICLCEECSKGEDKEYLSTIGYFNSPRDMVCGYIGSKDDEVPYLPQNDKKYKVSRKKPDIEDPFDDFDIFGDSAIERACNMLLQIQRKVKFSLNLEELLNSYSKDDIIGFAEANNLELSMKLTKKNMIKKYISEYKDGLINNINSMYEEKYNLIRELIKKNGVISANETTDKKLNYLQFLTSGIVFFVDKDGEEFFVMPNEIQEIIKENDTIDLRRKIKENTTFYKIFKGMLNAYGVLNENNLKRILKKYYNDVDEEELINRIMNEDNCVCECDIFYDNEERIFLNYEIEDYEEIKDIIKKDLEYADLSKEQLISMADEDYFLNNKVGKTFKKEFLALIDIDEDEIEEYMEELFTRIQFMDKKEVLELCFEEVYSRPNSEERFLLKKTLLDFIENISLWKYKGYTIKQIERKNVRNDIKVGRNDLCPCGSGKKYKKCCGSNDKIIKFKK